MFTYKKLVNFKKCTIIPVHPSDCLYRNWIHGFSVSDPRQIQYSCMHFSPCCGSVSPSLSLTAIKSFHQRSKHYSWLSGHIFGLQHLPLDLALFTYPKYLTQYALDSINQNLKFSHWIGFFSLFTFILENEICVVAALKVRNFLIIITAVFSFWGGHSQVKQKKSNSFSIH